jgi:hypothetical protein
MDKRPPAWHAGKLLPAAFGADGTELKRHRQELVDQHRPAPLLVRDALDPAFARQLDEGDSLERGLGLLAQERRVRGGAGASAGTPHALHER